MLQCFIDDSGVKGTHSLSVFAGFTGESDVWAMFSDAWSDCLKQDTCIRFLKMAQAAKLKGQFNKWSEEDRNAKLRSLVNVITSHAPRSYIFCSVDNAAHVSASFKGPFKDAYFLAFFQILQGLGTDILSFGSNEEFDLIFDEHSIFAPRVRQWYEFIRESWKANKSTLELSKILPPTPIFRSDTKFMPLQAADLLAWIMRHEFGDEAHEFDWISGALRAVIPVSPSSRFYVEETFDQMKRELENFRTKK